MPNRDAQDRRGRPSRGSHGLLDRESALQAIAGALELARAGSGQAVLFAGHPGMGKTRLHEAAIDEARVHGMRVLRGAGAALECHLAFGVAGQILRSLLTGLPHPQRAALLATAPVRVLSLAGAGDELASPPPAADLTISHGLFSIIAGACEHGPALLALDDLHWCDNASLEFILYLLHRLDELPIAVVMSRRLGRDQHYPPELDHLSAHRRVSMHQLRPLGAQAVTQLVDDALGAPADPTLVQACVEVTAGNPFYLHELLLELRESSEAGNAQLARRARTMAPDAVTRSLRVRVGKLGPAAAALARAVAILGDDAPLWRAAVLAGLTPDAAAEAADALAEVEILLAREPLRFVHPLVRHAIEVDIPTAEQATRHLHAARLLHEEGAEAEHVAAHLLLGRGQGDAWAVAQLRAAARVAVARSVPQSAIRYLERALQEPPDREERGEVLGELGMAEAAAGEPAAVEHLAAAALASSDPTRRAQLALAEGRALWAQGMHERAARAYDEGLAQLGPAPHDEQALALHDELQTGFIATAALVPALHARSVARSSELLSRALQGPRTHGQRLLLAQAATHASFGGEPATRVVDLCEQAWGSGQLLAEEGVEGIGWSLVTAGLTLSGALERGLELSEAAAQQARRRALPLAFATASYVRAFPLLWQGRVGEAVAELEHARDARRYGWRQYTRMAAGLYAACFLESGEIALAEAALTEDHELSEPRDLEDVYRLFVRAQLRLAQGRPADALQGALEVGRATSEAGVRVLGYAPWRELAAEAHQALGQSKPALALAHEAHELAEATGVFHARVRTLRLLGLTEREKPALERLRAARELGESGPPRLETIRALLELGAALRRTNRRSAAREPLVRAADLARQGGAFALYERARTELAATGARPRRELLLSGPESLTASERRIADLAAAGLSNREIGQTLFVTPKTVEYHLRNSFRKLGVERRHELPAALSEGLEHGGSRAA